MWLEENGIEGIDVGATIVIISSRSRSLVIVIAEEISDAQGAVPDGGGGTQ